MYIICICWSLYQLYLRIAIRMNTTIILKRKTRNDLRDIGSKGQTYDQLISELIKLKKNTMSLPKTIVEPDMNSVLHNS